MTLSFRRNLPLLLLWSVGAQFGCGNADLQRRNEAVQVIIRQARDKGAYECAPRQLAMAEAHNEFAAKEVDHGDYTRAKSHLEIADENAQEALRLSSDDRCARARTSPDTVEPAPGERGPAQGAPGTPAAQRDKGAGT